MAWKRYALVIVLSARAAGHCEDVRLPRCTDEVPKLKAAICWSNTAARAHKTQTLRVLKNPQTYRIDKFGQPIAVVLLNGVSAVTPYSAEKYTSLYAHRGELYMEVNPTAEPREAHKVAGVNMEHAFRLLNSEQADAVVATAKNPDSWYRVGLADGKYKLAWSYPPVDWFDKLPEPAKEPAPRPDLRQPPSGGPKGPAREPDFRPTPSGPPAESTGGSEADPDPDPDFIDDVQAQLIDAVKE